MQSVPQKLEGKEIDTNVYNGSDGDPRWETWERNGNTGFLLLFLVNQY